MLRAEAKGLFLQNVAEAQRLELAHEGSRQKPTLLPSEKKARGSFKKPEELLTALLLRAEARELLPQKTPRPRDLGSHPRGPRPTDPHARGANQKPGGPLTALSLRARDSGAPPATLPRPSGSGSHTSGLGKQPPRPSEKDGRGTGKKVGRTPDRPLAPCGGSGALPAPKIKTSDPIPLRSRGSKAGPPGVSTAAPGQKSQGRLRASLYERALCRVRDRQGGLRMGSHRREAPSHRGPANGLGTH